MTKKIILSFPPDTVNVPVTFHLIHDFNLVINIFKAKVTQEGGGILGIELDGSKEDIKKALKWIETKNVKILSILKEFEKYDDKCVDCGHCVTVCPVNAIKQDKKTLKVTVDTEKCVICGACAEACPLNAINCKN